MLEDIEIYKKELKLLNALGRVANTEDGKLVINYILSESCIRFDPFDVSKNSGDTSNMLGRQRVGRALVDKLIDAGTKVDGVIFSSRDGSRIDFLNKEISKNK